MAEEIIMNEESKEYDPLNSPCTIKEAVQIARAVAEDVITEYLQKFSQVQMAISLQVETLKEELFTQEVISEDKFKERLLVKASEAEEMKKKLYEQKMKEFEDNHTRLSMDANDIEVEVER